MNMQKKTHLIRLHICYMYIWSPSYKTSVCGSAPRGCVEVHFQFFFLQRSMGSTLASTVYHKNISHMRHTKNTWNFSIPKIFTFCILTFKRDHKILRNHPPPHPHPSIVKFSNDPKRISTKFPYPKNIHFLTPPPHQQTKNVTNSNFWTPKNRP